MSISDDWIEPPQILKKLDDLEKQVAAKDAMIASLVAERSYVKTSCCDSCKFFFDGPEDDAEVLIKEWNAGSR